MINTLFGTFTVNTTTDALTTGGVVGQSNAFGVFLHLSGEFGSATVTVQFRGEDGQYRPIADSNFTSLLDKQIIIPNNVKVRLDVTGATGTTDIYWQLSNMSQA